jgi:DNA polymerase/3'-5' exonuclease PolX
VLCLVWLELLIAIKKRLKQLFLLILMPNINENIINEFEKLIKFTHNNINNEKNNTFRLAQFKKMLNIIKQYPIEITLDNIKELEIIYDSQNNIIEDLENIIGVGRKTALKFIKMGITSVKMLNEKVESNEIKVSHDILIGLKYYGIVKGDIPRNEISKIESIIKNIIDKLNIKLNDNNKYIFEICGSYRRGKKTSGDIDILFSKLNSGDESHLKILINNLKKNIKLNNNQPLLIDDITYKTQKTKYMGIAKYKNNYPRRIDIIYIPYVYYYSALLYFTGSAELNLKMRKIAKKHGYKLSEYGLTKHDGTNILIKSEQDIFKILNIDYIPPTER